MPRSFGLRPKLLMLLVGGVVLLALVLSTITTIGLLRARTHAQVTAEDGLERQSSRDLQLLVSRSSTLTTERLTGAAAAGASASQMLVDAQSKQLINPRYRSDLQLERRPDGTRTASGAQLLTGLYVPASVTASEQDILRDAQFSAVLDPLLPQQHRSVRNILATAFVGPSGMIRFYPANSLSATDFSRELTLLEHLRNERNQVWLPPFTNLDLMGYSGIVTAVVTPVHHDDAFLGLVINYVSLSRLTSDLTQLSPTKDSFAFLIDQNRTLIATPPHGLAALTGQPPTPMREPIPLTQSSNQALSGIIERMAHGDDDIELVTLTAPRSSDPGTLVEREHFVVYQRIPTTGWSFGLAVPRDELNAEVAGVSQAINQTTREALLATILGALLVAALCVAGGLYFSERLTRPLKRLAVAAEEIGSGAYEQQVAIGSNDEIGQVARAFNAMSASVLRARDKLEQQNRQLEETVAERTADLQRIVGELGESLKQQESLYDLLRSVSTPVIPVARGVLLLPLIGALDQERARQALELLLQRVEAERSRIVILDVTGLPIIDTAVAATLLNAAQAARLLGAETVLAGIRPEVAETLITLDINLDELQPVANLQAAISLALQRAERRTSRPNGLLSPSRADTGRTN